MRYMKFEVEKHHCNVPDEELLQDLRRVARKPGKNKVTKQAYQKWGQYDPATLSRRFGPWFKALHLSPASSFTLTILSPIAKTVRPLWKTFKPSASSATSERATCPWTRKYNLASIF